MHAGITELGAVDLVAELHAGRLSAEEVVNAYLARIAAANSELNAIVHLEPERAITTARRLDRARGPKAALHGVPMTLKDAHRVRGMPTTVGNPLASRRPSSRDGAVAGRLRAAGANLIGKTNVATDLGDFGSDNPVHGRTLNPWDPSRTPGGSSGGAAAAVAAHLSPFEVGSDIAGSVRIPSAFCGVFGLKPSWGAVDTRGHVTEPVTHPLGGGVNQLAAVGPIARSGADLEMLFGVIAGTPRAPQRPVDASRLQLGVLPAFDEVPVEHSVSAALGRMASVAEAAGATVRHIDPPAPPSDHHRTWVEVYRAASAFGGRWAYRRPAVAGRRAGAVEAWASAFERVDAILMPVVMCVAFPHRGPDTPIEIDGVPVPYWRLARYTEPFNLTGLPALSVPAGLSRDGLPIGLQLVGRHGADRQIVRIGAWLSKSMQGS